MLPDCSELFWAFWEVVSRFPEMKPYRGVTSSNIRVRLCCSFLRTRFVIVLILVGLQAPAHLKSHDSEGNVLNRQIDACLSGSVGCPRSTSLFLVLCQLESLRCRAMPFNVNEVWQHFMSSNLQTAPLMARTDTSYHFSVFFFHGFGFF